MPVPWRSQQQYREGHPAALLIVSVDIGQNRLLVQFEVTAGRIFTKSNVEL